MSTDLVVQGTELVPSGTLFGTDSPAEVVQRASDIARTLEQVVRSQNLVVKIGQGEHVRVEGWTFLGSMLGVFPVVTWTRPVLKDDEPFGWEARVEARTRAGEIVGAAEAECLRSEPPWSFFPPPNKWGKTPPARDDFALRSMAQTRAVSKALRLPLGFVMQLAGFNPTPAEEMPVIEGRTSSGGGPEADRAPGAPEPSVAQTSVLVAESASPPDDPAAGTPFAYDIDAPIDPPGADADKPPTKKQIDALNGLVKQLENAGHITTLQVWQSMGIEPTSSAYEIREDGAARLRWSPLRDQLTRSQAHQLLDRLIPFADDKLPKDAA